MRIVVVFPAPFGPEEAVHLARRDGELEAVERPRRAEGLHEPGDRDRLRHGRDRVYESRLTRAPVPAGDLHRCALAIALLDMSRGS